jgi:hypothetical protein
MPDPSSEFSFSVLFVQLSAKGAVALWLAIPVSVVLLAWAWRIVARGGRLR